jgi:hypothetical protein
MRRVTADRTIVGKLTVNLGAANDAAIVSTVPRSCRRLWHADFTGCLVPPVTYEGHAAFAVAPCIYVGLPHRPGERSQD